jgi:hypothetical protein
LARISAKGAALNASRKAPRLDATTRVILAERNEGRHVHELVKRRSVRERAYGAAAASLTGRYFINQEESWALIHLVWVKRRRDEVALYAIGPGLI